MDSHYNIHNICNYATTTSILYATKLNIEAIIQSVQRINSRILAGGNVLLNQVMMIIVIFRPKVVSFYGRELKQWKLWKYQTINGPKKV